MFKIVAIYKGKHTLDLSYELLFTKRKLSPNRFVSLFITILVFIMIFKAKLKLLNTIFSARAGPNSDFQNFSKHSNLNLCPEGSMLMLKKPKT